MVDVITPIAEVNFADGLFTARPGYNGGDPRYSCILKFGDEALETQAYKNMQAAVRQVMVDKFGEAKMSDPNFTKGLRSPFRDCSEKDYAGFDTGRIFINAWSKDRPGIMDINRHTIHDPAEVWSGQLVRAALRPFAYENSGNRGASFGLSHIQIIVADRPRQDGRKSLEQSFSGEDAAIDPAQAAALGIDLAAQSSGSDSDDNAASGNHGAW